MSDHVIAKVSADITDVKADLGALVKDFKSFGERLQREAPEDPFKSLRKNAKDLGQIFGAAAPFLKAGQQAAAFEGDLRSLNTIIEKDDAALEEFGDRLRTISLELGTAQGSSASARAAFAIAGSGFEDAADAAKVLETTLKATTAGAMADAAPVAETLAGALKAYGAGASEAERFANVMFTTIKDGITTFPELTATMGNVAPIAAAAGISFEELGAAIAVTTGKGIKTSTAVDGLKGAITNLVAPSEQARNELDRLGVSVTEQSLRQKGLKNTLLEIAKANGGSAQSFKLILGDVQAFNAALALTGDGGAAFTAALDNAKKSSGALDDALAERNKTFQASMDQFKVALEAAGVAIGSVFLPVAKQLLDGVTGIVAAFATAPEPIRDVITTIGALGAATMITSKAIALLTTLAQREAIALGLSKVAQILSTEVVWAQTAALTTQSLAMGATEAAAVGLAGANLGLSTATAGTSAALSAEALAIGAVDAACVGFAGASTTATAATTGLTAAMQGALLANPFGAVMLAIGAAALVASAGIHYLTEEQHKLNEANGAWLAIEPRLSKGQRDYASTLGKTTKELREQGKVTGDLTDTLLANLERQEAAKEAGATATLARLQRENAEIRAQRQALAKDEADRKKGPETGDPDLKRTAAEQKAKDKFDKELSEKREEERKERLAADLSAVQVLKNKQDLSARQEIEALEKIKRTHILTKAEVRKLDEDIASAQGVIVKKNEESWKKAAEAAKKSAEDGKKAAEESYDLRAKALETERDSAKTIEARLDVEKQLVQLEAEKALFGEKNAKNRATILENAKAEKKLLDDTAKEEATKRDADLALKRGDYDKAAAEEAEAAQQGLFDKRQRYLDQEEAAGKNVAAQRRKLEEEQLAAAEQASQKKLEFAQAEIEARRKAADVGATPEQKALNADQAALELKKAQRQAEGEKQAIIDRSNASLMAQTAEYREQLRLLKERNAEEKRGFDSSFGSVTGADQLNENTAGLGVSWSKRRGAQAENGMSEADLEAAIARNTGILNSRQTKRDGANPNSSSFGVSKSARKAAEAKAAETKAAADPGEQLEVMAEQSILLKQLVEGVLLIAGNIPKTRGGGRLQPLGVPSSMMPNSNFS